MICKVSFSMKYIVYKEKHFKSLSAYICSQQDKVMAFNFGFCLMC